MTPMPNNTGRTTAQEKKLLIAQGAMYRLGLTESVHIARINLQPDVLAKSALNSLVTTTSAALGVGFSLKNIRDGNLQAILPLLVSGISLLAKRKSLIKPLLGGAIALAVAWALTRLTSRKRTKASDKVHSRSGKHLDEEPQPQYSSSED